MRLTISIMVFLIGITLTLPEELFYRKGILRGLLQGNSGGLGLIPGQYQHKSIEILMKLSRGLTKGIPIKVSPKYREKISKYLVNGDFLHIISVTEFVRVKYTIGILCVVFFFLLYLLNSSGMPVILIGITGIMGYYIPDNWLAGKVKKRQLALAKELPSVLSSLAITTDAGLNLLQAVEEVTLRSNSQLAQEFRRTLEDIRIGISQKQAFEKMAERCGVEEINYFVSALVQALEKGGGGITQLLREQAKESWDKRKDRAKDLAEKASIKLFMPLLLLVFPAFVIFLIGPMVFSIINMLFRP